MTHTESQKYFVIDGSTLSWAAAQSKGDYSGNSLKLELPVVKPGSISERPKWWLGHYNAITHSSHPDLTSPRTLVSKSLLCWSSYVENGGHDKNCVIISRRTIVNHWVNKRWGSKCCRNEGKTDFWIWEVRLSIDFDTYTPFVWTCRKYVNNFESEESYAPSHR